jgi:hypothetical protein
MEKNFACNNPNNARLICELCQKSELMNIKADPISNDEDKVTGADLERVAI